MIKQVLNRIEFQSKIFKDIPFAYEAKDDDGLLWAITHDDLDKCMEYVFQAKKLTPKSNVEYTYWFSETGSIRGANNTLDPMYQNSDKIAQIRFFMWYNSKCFNYGHEQVKTELMIEFETKMITPRKTEVSDIVIESYQQTLNYYNRFARFAKRPDITRKPYDILSFIFTIKFDPNCYKSKDVLTLSKKANKC